MSFLTDVSTAVSTVSAVINMASGGFSLTGLKFPRDEISAGGFWTKISVVAWTPIAEEDKLTDAQKNKIGSRFIGNLWLPMPLNLQTTLNQNYSEQSGMMATAGGTKLGSAAAQVGQEAQTAFDTFTSLNSSQRMGAESILNQKLGLLYEGPQLREHSFSWRLTPKNKEEQAAIENIVRFLKTASSPAFRDLQGDRPDDKQQENLLAAQTSATATIAAIAADKTIDELMGVDGVGRLAIPPTIRIEFWNDGKLNTHLFKVKDSFITSVDVNYTPAGGWTAYEDGAPMETQLTLTFKEMSIVMAEHVLGGY